jgi:hypothetical protein
MLPVAIQFAGGVPAAVYGFSAEVNQRFLDRLSLEDADVGGIGGTLAGNALSMSSVHRKTIIGCSRATKVSSALAPSSKRIVWMDRNGFTRFMAFFKNRLDSSLSPISKAGLSCMQHRLHA